MDITGNSYSDPQAHRPGNTGIWIDFGRKVGFNDGSFRDNFSFEMGVKDGKIVEIRDEAERKKEITVLDIGETIL